MNQIAHDPIIEGDPYGELRNTDSIYGIDHTGQQGEQYLTYRWAYCDPEEYREKIGAERFAKEFPGSILFRKPQWFWGWRRKQWIKKHRGFLYEKYYGTKK